MPAFVYILFSPSKNKYYVGYTSMAINERIRRHNTNHKGFTGGYGDWKLVYQEDFESKTAALAIEKEIKNWKNRNRIERVLDNKSAK